MASELTFVSTLMRAIEKAFPDAFVWKAADKMHLGIPDIQAVLPGGHFLAAEVKRVPKLFETGGLFEADGDAELLNHTFSGPQVSMLRRLEKAGATACGIVQTHQNLAYRLPPQAIPIHGQVTPTLLMRWGTTISRDDGWKFWNIQTSTQ